MEKNDCHTGTLDRNVSAVLEIWIEKKPKMLSYKSKMTVLIGQEITRRLKKIFFQGKQKTKEVEAD